MKFVIIVLDADSKTFIIYLIIQKWEKMAIDLIRKAQIEVQSHIQIKTLLFDETIIAISAKYSDYNNVFLAKNAAKLLEYTRITNHVSKLKEDKQSPFGLIYNLRLMKFKTLKTYIKVNLANGFLQSFKSPARASIFFD